MFFSRSVLVFWLSARYITQSFVFSFYSLLFFLLGIGRKSSKGRKKKKRKEKAGGRRGEEKRGELKKKKKEGLILLV